MSKKSSNVIAFNIAFSDFDRRRKVTKSMAETMKVLKENGVNAKIISKAFGISVDTVKRNTDMAFNKTERQRKKELAQKEKYTSDNSIARQLERNEYKKNILASNNIHEIDYWAR